MHTNKYIDDKRCKGENGKKECRFFSPEAGIHLGVLSAI